jgi:hypothetical protein
MKKILILAVICFMAYTAQAQETINGVTVEPTLTIENEELTLNGAGLREKLWYDLYVGALYTPQKFTDGNKLIGADVNMAITLDITDENVTQEAMKEAVNDGFYDSCTSKERKAIAKEIETFIGFFKDAIVEGDSFTIAYVVNKGTIVSKNGKYIGTIEGYDFKKGLFGIWLGNDPADADLKEAMLGIN